VSRVSTSTRIRAPGILHWNERMANTQTKIKDKEMVAVTIIPVIAVTEKSNDV